MNSLASFILLTLGLFSTDVSARTTCPVAQQKLSSLTSKEVDAHCKKKLLAIVPLRQRSNFAPYVQMCESNLLIAKEAAVVVKTTVARQKKL